MKGRIVSIILVFMFVGYAWAAVIDCSHLAPEPPNLGRLKIDVTEYKKSGAWDKAVQCILQDAKKILQKYMPAQGKKLAIILDIDETVLFGWDQHLKMDFGYNHDIHKAWEFTAQARTLQPVVDFYTFARNNGFAVFFISGRRENQRTATIMNLNKVGIDNWTGLFLKPMDYKQRTAEPFKSKWRAHIQQLGYTIVLSIGDQLSDFSGEPKARYNLKLPNPIYIIP